MAWNYRVGFCYPGWNSLAPFCLRGRRWDDCARDCPGTTCDHSFLQAAARSAFSLCNTRYAFGEHFLNSLKGFAGQNKGFETEIPQSLMLPSGCTVTVTPAGQPRAWGRTAAGRHRAQDGELWKTLFWDEGTTDKPEKQVQEPDPAYHFLSVLSLWRSSSFLLSFVFLAEVNICNLWFVKPVCL